MDIRKLQRAIVDGLEDVKAQDILVFNTEHLSPLFERVIIATGSSNRKTKSLASSVREAVKGAGFPVLATEGGDNGEWIIVDCGAAVAHIMQGPIREYYRLEDIWGGKPVRIKLGGGDGRKGLVKASEDEDDEDEAPMAAERKAAAKKGAAKKAAPAKAEQPARPAKAAKPVPATPGSAPKKTSRTAAKKPAGPTPAKPSTTAPAKKGAAAKRAAPRKTVEPKGPVSQTIVVKPVARKTAAVKTAKGGGGRAAAPAKRPAAKKAAPRKTAGRRG